MNFDERCFPSTWETSLLSIRTHYDTCFLREDESYVARNRTRPPRDPHRAARRAALPPVNQLTTASSTSAGIPLERVRFGDDVACGNALDDDLQERPLAVALEASRNLKMGRYYKTVCRECQAEQRDGSGLCQAAVR